MMTSTLKSSEYLALQPLAQREFDFFRQWLFSKTGISLNDSKKSLVNGRLSKRLNRLGVGSYTDYIRIIRNGDTDECQTLINILTTNETYFFREQKHFDFLLNVILPEYKDPSSLSFWSAASSTGEEAYTTAFLLAERFGSQAGWSIKATDINTEVVRIAQRGVYPLDAAMKIPEPIRKKYCLKGKGKDQGFFRICPEIRRNVMFSAHNLMQPLAGNLPFDVVFLRNVLIYFDMDEKKKIIQNVMNAMQPDGWLLVGHSESITGYHERLKQCRPGCYRLLSHA